MTRSKTRTLVIAAICALLLIPGATIALAGTTPRSHHVKRSHHAQSHHSSIPQHNGGDHDPDNNGAPSDGDGNR